MTLLTSNAGAILTPEEIGDLVIRPVQAQSIALQAATVIRTNSSHFRIPVVASDPSAGWVAEGAEISPSDATLVEIDVVPRKLAGLSIVSNELAADSSPEATEIVANGLARDIATKLDQAFFGNTTANGPAGIQSLASTAVDRGASWANLDPFTAATFAAEATGAQITAWCANPADAALLANLKEATGSNKPLLGSDPTQPGKRLIGGIPVLVSPAVTVGTVWGIPRDRVVVVVRNDVQLETDGSQYFSSDRTAIRAKLRVGIGWPHPAAIVRVYDAP